MFVLFKFYIYDNSTHLQKILLEYLQVTNTCFATQKRHARHMNNLKSNLIELTQMDFELDSQNKDGAQQLMEVGHL